MSDEIPTLSFHINHYQVINEVKTHRKRDRADIGSPLDGIYCLEAPIIPELAKAPFKLLDELKAITGLGFTADEEGNTVQAILSADELHPRKTLEAAGEKLKEAGHSFSPKSSMVKPHAKGLEDILNPRGKQPTKWQRD